MSRKKKIIIIVALALVAGVAVFLNWPKKEESIKEQDVQYISMEDDGVVLTQKDIDGRKEIEKFGTDEALDYFDKIYKVNYGISLDSTEWYFTDDNDNDNILVSINVVDESNTMKSDHIVVEVDSSKGFLRAIGFYPPDSRYSL